MTLISIAEAILSIAFELNRPGANTTGCVPSARLLSLATSPLILIGVSRANSGTTLVLDGQETHPLEEGERLIFRRHLHHAGLIGNPESPYWNTLIEKMRWGAPPTYRDRGT